MQLDLGKAGNEIGRHSHAAQSPSRHLAGLRFRELDTGLNLESLETDLAPKLRIGRKLE
jgi:hypothetical protein